MQSPCNKNHWNIGAKSLSLGTNLTSPFLMSCMGVVFNHRALLSAHGERPSFGNSLGLFGDSCGVPLANKSIRCNPIPVLEVAFGDKRWAVGILSLLLLVDLI